MSISKTKSRKGRRQARPPPLIQIKPPASEEHSVASMPRPFLIIWGICIIDDLEAALARRLWQPQSFSSLNATTHLRLWIGQRTIGGYISASPFQSH